MESLARINGTDGEQGTHRVWEGEILPPDEHFVEGPSEEAVGRVAAFLGQFAAALLKREMESQSHFKVVPDQMPDGSHASRIEPPTV